MMNEETTILIAEDDPGHALLIRKNLERAGLANPKVHFKDGQETVDYLFSDKEGLAGASAFVLLLDIRMPKLDGIEVLRRLKQDQVLRAVPVIMLTTTDDPLEVERCEALGCSRYVTKPVGYDDFVAAMDELAAYLKTLDVPTLN
jgi:CheY-like chemotaxis protein